MSIALGDLPTWIAAIGGIAAACIAWRTWVRGREHARRAQAEHVAGWVEYQRDIEEAGGFPGVLRSRRLIVSNGSAQPVMDVTAEVRASGVHGGTECQKTASIIPPAAYWPVPLDDDVPIELPSVGGSRIEADQSVQVAIAFTDAAGQRWRREFDGRLSEQRSPAQQREQRPI